ncbi:MAG: linear amide C-N hydrolase [Candidatus Zhuqueibacterota bacterium]
MNWIRTSPKLFLYLAIFLIIACKDESIVPQQTTKPEQIQATLESLELLDDYPLYTMQYHGDYGFDDYLRTGVLNAPPGKTAHRQSASPSPRFACTCFAAMGASQSMVFSRNFDFFHRPTLMLFTDPPNGCASVSMVDMYYLGYDGSRSLETLDDREILLQAPYLPFDGMNEYGVTIGMMAVPNAEPPFDPNKVTIYELALIRLVLDYATTTEDAIRLIGKYNLAVGSIPVHFLIADPSGHSAVIEFVNGKMHVLPNTELWQVATNFIIYGSNAPEQTSCWRYDAAYSDLKKATGKKTRDSAMVLLQRVAQESTMWSIVFDMSNVKVQVTVGQNFSQVYSFDVTP